MLSRSPVIVHDTRPEIGDALLTLISRMGQRSCNLPFYVSSQAITPLWINVTMQHFDCRNDQTKFVDILLMLTLEMYLHSLGAQLFCSKFIPLYLTANIPFQDMIISIQTIEASQFLSHRYSHRQFDKCHSSIASWRSQPVCYGIQIHLQISDI